MGISRVWATILLIVLLGGFVAVPIIKAIPVLTDEAKNIQHYIPRAESLLREKYNYYRKKVEAKTGFAIPTKIFDDAIVYAQSLSKGLLVGTTNFLRSFLEWTFLVPLLLFFIVVDGRHFRNNFIRIVPNPFFERFYFILYNFNKQLGDYIFAKAIEASIIGVIITTGLLIMNFPFAWPLGLLAALTNVVPYLGPFLGALPALIISFTELGADSSLMALSLLYIIANILDLAIVFPILVSKIVNLHPVLVVISVILGSQYWGVIGMIISIPIAAVGQLVFEEFYREFYMSGHLDRS